jgi:hypothetical protein
VRQLGVQPTAVQIDATEATSELLKPQATEQEHKAIIGRLLSENRRLRRMLQEANTTLLKCIEELAAVLSEESIGVLDKETTEKAI